MIDHELQGQYEALDLENHRMRKAVAKLMARLTVWLDDDQFNEADGIMHPKFAPQCKPLATVPAAVDVGAAQAETAQAAPVVPEALHTFLNAAAGEGLVIGGVDAADLYIAIFPERYAQACATPGATHGN